jgi:flagellar basal-body rod protein FlgG
MFQPLYVAATGLSAMEEEILTITDNLANAKTVGFKKGRAEMESLFTVERSFDGLLQDAIEESDVVSEPVEFGSGVRISSTPRDFSQGSVETTNSSLDLAVQGEGFFQFRMQDGSMAYGRAGNLHMDNEGNLVDPNGHKLDPEIILPEGTTSVVIRQDGTVLAAINDENEYVELGQIDLVRFTNPGGLKSIGQNLFQATESSGEALIGIAGEEGFGTIRQFALEQSNVDVISEMMKMVMVQRVFDTVTKAVQSYQNMLASLERMKQ